MHGDTRNRTVSHLARTVIRLYVHGDTRSRMVSMSICDSTVRAREYL